MRFLLDTDSLIDLDKGKPIMLAVAKYPASSFVTSAVCAFEFDVGYFGFAGKASPYKIAHKGVKVLPLSKEIALEAARVLSQAAFDKRIEKAN